jgi:sugar phosphate isomerase/epimerase
MTTVSHLPTQEFSLDAMEQLPGFYYIEAEVDRPSFIRDCKEWGLDVLELNGRKVHGPTGYFKELNNTFEFSEEIEGSWEEASEALRSLTWEEGDCILVLHSAADRFATAEPRDWKTMMEVWQDTIDYWSDLGVSLYMVFQD